MAMILGTAGASAWLDYRQFIIFELVLSITFMGLSMVALYQYYNHHISKMMEHINFLIQTSEPNSPFRSDTPREFKPITHGFLTILKTMERQRLLSQLLREVASTANFHINFKSASESAIEQFCEITGWEAADLFLPKSDQQLPIFEPIKRHFKRSLTRERSNIISQCILNAARPLDIDHTNFHLLEKPLWYKTNNESFHSIEFVIPIIVKSKVEAVIILYGYPEIDFNTTLFKVMNVISTELSQVKEREMRERDLKETTDLMVQAGKMATIGEMAAGIAHEINNPLQIIQGRVEQISMIAEDLQIEHKVFKLLTSNLESAVFRLSSTISGLKNISYNESLEGFTYTQLSKILTDITSTISEKIQRNDIDFQILGEINTDIHVQCHRSQIAQIIINFINNSIEAISSQKDPWITLDYNVDQSQIYFRVTDSGAGIDPKMREQIMNPYFTTKKKGRGVGLGLNISKKIAELHEGRIYIDTSSKYTCFVLCIPIDQDSRRDSA